MIASSQSLQFCDWARFDAVVFDVDGTLYDQKLLRRRMFVELVVQCVIDPGRIRDIRVLATFRKLREANAGREEAFLETAQYNWAAEALNLPLDTVRRVVEEWIYRRPLRHLLYCRPPGLHQLFKRLADRNVKIGVFSDYPVADKLAALDLRCGVFACATDSVINRFKPHPAGLQHVISVLGVSPERCLHIGDRTDRDEVFADRAGCKSLILSAHSARNLGRARSYDLLFPENASGTGVAEHQCWPPAMRLGVK